MDEVSVFQSCLVVYSQQKSFISHLHSSISFIMVLANKNKPLWINSTGFITVHVLTLSISSLEN